MYQARRAWGARGSVHVCLSGVLLSLLSGLAVAAPDGKSGGAIGYARGHVLVVPRAGLPGEEVDKTLQQLAPKANRRNLSGRIDRIDLPDGVDEIDMVNRLRASGRFKSVELDVAVAPGATVSDPDVGSSWALTKIGATTAWDSATGDGVVVAVLDTGVNSDHPDLAANMVAGWNTYNKNADTADVYGHGTKVAGAIAMAANNGIGSAGVAYRAKIMPIRVSDESGYAYFSTIAAGIEWAADHGAKVVNVSFSDIAGSSSIQNAADYFRSKGGLVVIAAGNSSSEATYPASDKLIVVSATQSNDTLASFSTTGAFVDIAAPGVGIYTTSRDGAFASVSGTSFASPVTAATLALVFSANPALSPAEAESILFSTAKDLGTAGKDKSFGYGRVDAAAAVAAAVVAGGGQVVQDSVAPTVAIGSPSSGSTVRGVVNVDVSASDDRGVERVDLLLDNILVASDTSAPFAFALDSAAYSDGTHVLTARAADAAGNVGVSGGVTVTVSNGGSSAQTPSQTGAPTITSFSLTDGQVITGSDKINITATATDDVAVTRIELWQNGWQLTWRSGNSLNTNVGPTTLNDGANTFKVVAKDGDGHVTEKSVTVYKGTATVTPDTQAPVVGITSPAGGTTLSGAVTVAVNATDNTGVASVDLYLNGVKVGSDTSAPYSFNLDTTAYADGAYTLVAKAVDAAGNVGASSSVAVTVSNAPQPEAEPNGGNASPALPEAGAPTITSFSLTDGQVITGSDKINITATATDDVAVTRIELWQNGWQLTWRSGNSLNTNVGPTTLNDGANTFKVVAKDGDGHVTEKSVTVYRQ